MSAGEMGVAIRTAGVDDASALADLRWISTTEFDHATMTRDEFTHRFRRTIEAFRASGRWTIWLAEVDDAIVGMLFVERIDKVPRPVHRPASWGYVTGVYVAPAHRNGGIGEMLLNAAIDASRRDDWELLLLWPRDESRAFYARAGFEPSTGALELVLSPQDQ